MTNFNPRAPCGARLSIMPRLFLALGFQSTRPLRGATAATESGGMATNIPSHAPLAGRDFYIPSGGCIKPISIHAPLAGRD